jgi:nucleoid-associated protein YgaU
VKEEEAMTEEKPRPNFGNVQSGGSSTAPEPAPPATANPSVAPGPTRTYTVVAGDSLSKIAKKFYGDANKWKAIFEANRATVKNPDLIHPGQVLNIPDA